MKFSSYTLSALLLATSNPLTILAKRPQAPRVLKRPLLAQLKDLDERKKGVPDDAYAALKKLQKETEEKITQAMQEKAQKKAAAYQALLRQQLKDLSVKQDGISQELYDELVCRHNETVNTVRQDALQEGADSAKKGQKRKYFLTFFIGCIFGSAISPGQQT